MVASHPMIELRALHRYFGATRAVCDISFEVQAGHVFGYIGPNGAGKTTSMRILATLDEPTYGDAFVDGFSVVSDPDRVRKRLGFMPDAFGTYSNVNVREYLDFFARSYDMRGKARLAAMDRVMEFTGLDGLAEKPINGLSKGMKQRLCLGRALIHDPPVLIMDEPAAGLDPRARIQLREMIRNLAVQGKSILISSHILTELAEMCDTVGIIELGRLLAVGGVDQIRHGPETAAARQVKITVIGAGDTLAGFLVERFQLQEVAIDGEDVYASHSQERDFEADLLRGVVEAGFRVTAFGSHQKTLEDVFMQVTEGRVQ
jgi:ABC-2 type transport system ATP-binding protein